MKFINNPKNIKVGYIYNLIDYDNDIVLVESINGDKFTGISIFNKENYSISLTRRMSPVLETSDNFNEDTQFAFYEIGTKETHPEYFL